METGDYYDDKLERRTKGCWPIVLAYWVALALIAAGITFCFGPSDPETRCDTVTVVRVDTHFVEKPVPRDSLIVRYVTVTVPVAEDTAACGGQAEAHLAGDSVAVELPITQKHYADSTYEAWVSGYAPALDSILVYNRTVEQTVTVTMKEKAPRFGIGLQVGTGYGIISRKPDVYVGVGGYWRIW